MTTTFDHRFGAHRMAAAEATTRTMPASLAVLGMFTILISAWGGIVPYVGPTFGYHVAGTSAWSWTSSHAVLALVPGAIGLLAGMVIWARSSNLSIGGGRIGLAFAGLVALVCGAWFVIGPFAWPVIEDNRPYFVPASPFRMLADLVGASLGTGVILAACGAFALGWAVRHRRPLDAAAIAPAARTSRRVTSPRVSGRESAVATPTAGAADVSAEMPAVAPATDLSNVPDPTV